MCPTLLIHSGSCGGTLKEVNTIKKLFHTWISKEEWTQRTISTFHYGTQRGRQSIRNIIKVSLCEKSTRRKYVYNDAKHDTYFKGKTFFFSLRKSCILTIIRKLQLNGSQSTTNAKKIPKLIINYNKSTYRCKPKLAAVHEKRFTLVRGTCDTVYGTQ